MNMLQKAGTMAAIAVTGAAVAVGGIGLAAAEDGTSADSTSQVSGRDGGFGRGPGGPGSDHGPGGHRGGPGMNAAALAEALGLEEAEVIAAFEAIRDDLRPEPPADGETRTPPTEAEREAFKAEMIAALAAELGVSEADLTDAFDALADDRRAEVRDALSDRLDDAVEAGTLTEGDKASVLKAFDAEVLGFGPHHDAD
jgi:hypothetical protein